MNELEKWQNLNEEQLGGGIYYAQDSKQAADYISGRRNMHRQLIRLAENWSKNQRGEEVGKITQYFGQMSELVTDMFTEQLNLGRQETEKRAIDAVPNTAKRLATHLQNIPYYMSRYKPLLASSGQLLEISGPVELAGLLKNLEDLTYRLYCDEIDMPIPIILGSQDSRLGQIEWEMYYIMPDYDQEKKLAVSKKKIDQLHSEVKETNRPMIGDLLFTGGWGVGSVACGQALQNVQTFYLFPKSIKELRVTQSVMDKMGIDTNLSAEYLAKIYVMHEHAHVYYPDTDLLYSEVGPDLNVLEVLLLEAINSSGKRKEILSVILTAYSKDVFFADGDELMQAYQASSAIAYSTLVNCGLFKWNKNRVDFDASDKNLSDAIDTVRCLRRQMHQTGRCEIPDLPKNLEQAFVMLGLPVN